MNTAMRELLEYMDKDNVRYVGQVIEKAKQLLKLEREQMGLFSEWCFNNGYHYMSDGQWLDFNRKTVFTDQLINTYIDTIK